MPIKTTGFALIGSDNFHLYYQPNSEAIEEAIECLQVALKHTKAREAKADEALSTLEVGGGPRGS